MRVRCHWAETGRSRSSASTLTPRSWASVRTPSAVRQWRRVAGSSSGGVGHGVDQPPAQEALHGLVDRAPRPPGEGDRLQPVEEGHAREEVERLGLDGPHASCSRFSAGSAGDGRRRLLRCFSRPWGFWPSPFGAAGAFLESLPAALMARARSR